MEHNNEEPKKSMIRELLNYHGYMLERDVGLEQGVLGFDDWFVSKCVSGQGMPTSGLHRTARSRAGRKDVYPPFRA